MPEQWVTIKAAAKKLDIHTNKISRWGNRGLIEVRSNPYDKRSRLVNLVELREKLADLNAIQDLGEENKE